MLGTDQAQAGDYASYLGKEHPLHGEILQKWRDGLTSRSSREREWYVAREFWKGNHYAVWVQGRGIVDIPASERAKAKPRLVYNKVRVQLETILAYLLKNEPVFTVVANTGEPEDQAAAMVARQVLYHYWSALNCGEKLERTGLWALLCGKAFWKVGWNPMGGPKVPIMQQVPPPPLPLDIQMQIELGQMSLEQLPPEMWQPQEVQVGEQPAGEVTIDVVSPLELIPDPGAENLDDAQWVMHVTMLPVHQLRARFPQFAEKIKSEDGEHQSGVIGRVLSSFGGGDAKLGKDKLKRVQVFEYWHRKCDEYPEGLRVIATKACILDAGPTPPGYEEIPFSEWTDRMVPGEFWADSTAKDMIPLNKELNAGLSQMVLQRKMFKNKILAPIGSIDESQFNNEDAEVVEYQQGQRPEVMPPPPIPDALLKSMDAVVGAMENVSAAEGVLQGKVGGDVRSGRQVAYQGQYGETRISLLAKHMSRFLERAGKLILTQATENVTEQRIAKIVGKNRQQEVVMWKGADIRGNTDVTVETGSLLGFTKTERFDKLMQMQERGIIGPDRVLSAMEMEDFNNILEPKAQDRNNALRENAEWRAGKYDHEVLYFEDHPEHVSVHNMFRKSAAYRALDPMARQQVDQHCQEHETFVAMAMTPGGIPPGGQAGPAPGPGGEPPPNPEMVNGAPATPEAMKQSGQELAEGLPPVPPVADSGPENQH